MQAASDQRNVYRFLQWATDIPARLAPDLGRLGIFKFGTRGLRNRHNRAGKWRLAAITDCLTVTPAGPNEAAWNVGNRQMT